ncbi:MAG: ABC transporter permease [Flavobacteriales bacterium]|nr:ABC transporter permease [Flavobacteriales bacterium]MCB9205390.1 ABC transporter permease [Flavobacteriales bacterium]
MTNYTVILDITRTHLLSRIKQTGVAALGVTFGIGMFIIMISFMTGLNGLLDGLILNRTPHIHIYNEIEPSEAQPVDLLTDFSQSFNVVSSIKPKQSQVRIHNALPLISQLKKDERVKGVTPQVNANVFYLAGSIQINGMITGINVLDEVDLFNFGDYIVEGNPQDLVKNNKGILLGSGIAAKMSARIGDRVQVKSVNGSIIPLKIVGIFQSGLATVDNVQSYVNLKTAQQLQGGGNDYISDINVKLWDMELAPKMSKEISSHHKLTAIDIKTANAQFDTGSAARNLITYVVSITLLTVAGFGIYNILNMLIYEKMNDIAILKATGFSGNDVKLIFMSQALLIGLVGGILGLLLGLAGSFMIDNIPYNTPSLPSISTYPVTYDYQYYLIGISFALVSTFLAGYLPAKKAEKIDPVDIIRGQ